MLMESKNKFYGIMRQKYNIEELDNKIRNCENGIQVANNKKKIYKKWAIIPPIVIMASMLLGEIAINIWFNNMEGINLLTLFDASKISLLVPVIVSVGFPIFYGMQYYSEDQSLKNLNSQKNKLEEYRKLNAITLKRLEKEYRESQKTILEENIDSSKILNEFFNSEKERLIELYSMGRLSDFERLGWPIEDIVYLQSLIESEINYRNSHVQTAEMNLRREKPKKTTTEN